MSLLRYGLVTLFSALVPTSASAQTAPRAQDEAADIRALESALVEALHARNRDQLERLLAQDYVLRGSPDVDRETWLRNATTMCWGSRSDFGSFRAREHGGVAIASFELTFYMDPTTCRPALLRSLITDVWIRETDGWKLQVRHAGAPPEPDANIAAQYGLVPEPPPTWEANSELSLVATGGNTSTRTIGLGAQVTHRGDSTSTEAALAFLTSEADSETKARSLTIQGRQSLAVADPLQLFGELSYSRDRFAGIDDRASVTTGLAYTASFARLHALRVEGGIGLTVEQRLDARTLRFATATAGLDYQWIIRPGTELSEDFAVNADLESGRNWRTVSTTALSVSMTELLSLKASHALEYRHTPVVGFGRTDLRTAVALVLSLERRRTVR